MIYNLQRNGNVVREKDVDTSICDLRWDGISSPSPSDRVDDTSSLLYVQLFTALVTLEAYVSLNISLY